MRSRRTRLTGLLTATVLLGAAACGSATTGDTDAMPVALSETGSTLLYPLFSEWGPAYQQQHPHVTISTQDGGSGAGIAQVAAGAVDIGASDAYLSEGDMKQHPGLMNIALAISAQQINYNLPSVTEPIKLDGKVLAAMYSGTVKTWNDPQITALNPGLNLPDTPVVPLHRSDGSGDTFLFTQYLSKQDPDGWGKAPGFGTTVDFPAVPGALGENGNGAMVTGCAANPGCIAYVSISQQDEARAHRLGTAQLANAAGHYLLPDAKGIQAAAAGFADQTPDNQAVSLINGPAPDAYPIVNYEYAIVNVTPKATRDKATAQALQAFLHWAVTDGSSPSFLDKVHLQPLPDAVAKQSQAQIAKIGAAH
ncbi:phosphate ABC transporter substrate-binding protein PstS [Mycolicibacter terrae]|uniref:Phosphate-binding protein n=2 Tax=Mycolicibacter TaxID=1073531 RepID=A0A1A2XYW9_MYCSD|nr:MULTISPECIES: phosphate ABC transporter substrate-binding protein PstS [Mycolicibacter]OBI30960.1 phosphate ABC transporter substrate-binding protein PstS [Mycolicibacter sinensis]RRR48622.1 phosphate ABC transporter substrate-binding protein PstS [Mycolicibacter terrae]